MCLFKHSFIDAYDWNGRAFRFCKHCYKKESNMIRKRVFLKEGETETYVQVNVLGNWLVIAHYIRETDLPVQNSKKIGAITLNWNRETDEHSVVKDE